MLLKRFSCLPTHECASAASVCKRKLGQRLYRVKTGYSAYAEYRCPRFIWLPGSRSNSASLSLSATHFLRGEEVPTQPYQCAAAAIDQRVAVTEVDQPVAASSRSANQQTSSRQSQRVVEATHRVALCASSSSKKSFASRCAANESSRADRAVAERVFRLSRYIYFCFPPLRQSRLSPSSTRIPVHWA